MKQLTQLYSFTDIAKDSGAPYNMKIDLDGTLDKISSKISNGDYKGDYAFEAGNIEFSVTIAARNELSNFQLEFLIKSQSPEWKLPNQLTLIN